METKYHIYLNNKCINYNLEEKDFRTLWDQYAHMSEIHGGFNLSDLSYEEVVFDKKEYSIQGI
jgi:hypothetical protein